MLTFPFLVQGSKQYDVCRGDCLEVSVANFYNSKLNYFSLRR